MVFELPGNFIEVSLKCLVTVLRLHVRRLQFLFLMYYVCYMIKFLSNFIEVSVNLAGITYSTYCKICSRIWTIYIYLIAVRR